MSTHKTIKAPRGLQLSCKGWHQEAALRMLMNNLDEEVGEDPSNLIVYGGRGKAARNWPCYEAIVAALKELENDETLLVQSGKGFTQLCEDPDYAQSKSPGALIDSRLNRILRSFSCKTSHNP